MGLRLALAAVIAGCPLVTACGGGGGSAETSRSSTPSLASQPVAAQPLSAEMPGFQRAVESRSCRRFVRFEFSVTRGRPPGSAPAGNECRARNPALASLRGARMERAAEFGTGGVMEGASRSGGRAYTVWALDGDGHFRYVNVSGVSRQVGTRFVRRAEARRTATRFLRAVRGKDCPAIERLLDVRGSRLVVSTGSPRAACRAILGGRILVPALRRTPRERIAVLGGTQRLAFVGVATRRTYFTMLLGATSGPKLRVFDVLPSTPVKLPMS